MKKMLILLVVCLLVTCSFCGCSGNQGKDPIGYVIIPHVDGEEHVEITTCWITSGVLNVKTVEGVHIISNDIVVVYY